MTKVVRVKAQEQAVPAILAQWKMAADGAVSGYEGVQRAELVSKGIDPAILVGRDETPLAGCSIGGDRLQAAPFLARTPGLPGRA